MDTIDNELLKRARGAGITGVGKVEEERLKKLAASGFLKVVGRDASGSPPAPPQFRITEAGLRAIRDSESTHEIVPRIDHDVDLLVDALRRTFPDGPPERTFGDWGTAAMNVLDCVLSLNRRYYPFCEQRLDRFRTAHPDVETVEQLLELIGKYRTPLEFSVQELDYRDANRAQTLVGVCQYMNTVQTAFEGETEMARFREWAKAVTPDGYEAPGVRGFGLAGFQYLRMLFGAETAKPDVHVRRFVAEAVGHPINDTTALTLLETAAKHLDWHLTALDNEIWEFRAQSGKLSSEITVDKSSRSTVAERNRSVNSESIKVVLKAYSTVDERGEMPSTYPSRNPRYFYVPKPGKNLSSGLKKDYIIYDFEIFRPYVKVVRRDSQGIYYDLIDELKPQLRQFKS